MQPPDDDSDDRKSHDRGDELIAQIVPLRQRPRDTDAPRNTTGEPGAWGVFDPPENAPLPGERPSPDQATAELPRIETLDDAFPAGPPARGGHRRGPDSPRRFVVAAPIGVAVVAIAILVLVVLVLSGRPATPVHQAGPSATATGLAATGGVTGLGTPSPSPARPAAARSGTGRLQRVRHKTPARGKATRHRSVGVSRVDASHGVHAGAPIAVDTGSAGGSSSAGQGTAAQPQSSAPSCGGASSGGCGASEFGFER
jgi:hypothetical protein